MSMEDTDNIIKLLKMTDIHGELGSIATHLNTTIFDLIDALVRMGLQNEHYRLNSVLSFPPHTPPFKNKYINNNKNPVGVLFSNLLNNKESNPIVSGSFPKDLSPMAKKAERKNNRKPKNKRVMPLSWTIDRENETISDQMLVDYCEKHGHDWHSAKELFLAFVDHHLSKGSKFVKWDNAFYTWVRNDKKFNGAPAKKNGNVLSSYKKSNQMEDLFNND